MHRLWQDGMEEPEIAEIMEMTPAAVKKELLTLKRAVKEYGLERIRKEIQ